MGKCVDQVYFMEKWSKGQGLKIAISQQFSYVNFSMIIERECYIYNISISLPPLSLSKYIGGCERCGRTLHPLPLFRTVSDLCEILLENFPKYRSVGQLRFTQQTIAIVKTC